MTESVDAAVALGGPGVAGGQDAAHHRGQVRREEHLGAEDLLHLGRVAVGQQPVGGEVLVDRPEVQRLLEPAARPRDARRRVDHDPGPLHQAASDQRGQGQPGRGRVAAGGGHEGRPGQALPEQLGQPVDRLGQQPRRAVLLAVPARVERRVDAGGSPRPGPRPRRPGPGARGRAAGTRRAAARRTRGRGRRSGRDRSPRRPGPGRRPASEGVCAPTAAPAWEWAEATATSKAGCPASRRSSSAPV